MVVADSTSLPPRVMVKMSLTAAPLTAASPRPKTPVASIRSVSGRLGSRVNRMPAERAGIISRQSTAISKASGSRPLLTR